MQFFITMMFGVGGIFLFVWLWMRDDINRVRQQRLKMLQFLKTQRPWEYMKVTRSSSKPSDEMHKNARSGKVDAVLRKIDDTSAPFHVDRENENGETCLMIACRRKNKQLVQGLVERKANTDIVGRPGTSALHICTTMGYVELVKYLIENKADLNLMTKNAYDEDNKMIGPPILPLNALMVSIMHKNDAITQLLLDSKANANIEGDSYKGEGCPKLQPIHCAVRVRRAETVQLLCRYGANVGNTSIALEGYTPLGFSAYKGLLDITRTLLDNNADPNANASKKRGGFRAGHCAVLGGHIEVLKLLLERGADMELKDDAGLQPLDVALGRNMYSIAKLLDPSSVLCVEL